MYRIILKPLLSTLDFYCYPQKHLNPEVNPNIITEHVKITNIKYTFNEKQEQTIKEIQKLDPNDILDTFYDNINFTDFFET